MRFGALVLCLFAASCTPPKLAFEKGSRPEIRKVALLASPEPALYESEGSAALPGALFGLLALPYLMAEGLDKTERATKALSQQGTTLGAVLNDAVESGLRAKGYEVVRVDVQRLPPPAGYLAEPRDPLLEDYKSVPTDADALVDVAILSAGIRGGGFSSYRPLVHVKARVVDGATRKVIHSRGWLYGPDPPWRAEDVEPAPAVYRFSSFDAALREPDRAADGLRQGALWAARKVADTFP